MTKMITLTHQQRERILKKLSTAQISALSEFTRYAMISQFHTSHYLKQTDWEFQGMVVDPWYHRDHDHHGQNLYCDCGRRLKNQFILRSRSTGRQLFLGISHFQQHASIPPKVTREIQAGINKINLYMDNILLAYQAGRRFPQHKFNYIEEHHGFKNRESTIFYQRCSLFSQVNLPLHPRDFEELTALYHRVQRGQSQRLTKVEIKDLLGTIADDWRQIDQQVVLFNYYLRQRQLPVQSIRRIKSNSINYALQRRKSRFFIQEHKQIMALTLTKARAQLAIKLRQLSFYLQLMEDLPAMSIVCEQARQIMVRHKTSVSHSHFFGIKEAKCLLKNNHAKS